MNAFLVGVYQPRTARQVIDLRRTAAAFDASAVFQVGGDEHLAPDSARVQHWWFPTVEEVMFNTDMPVVALETGATATPLSEFTHPERAAYLIGDDNGWIPKDVLALCQHVVKVDTPRPNALYAPTAAAVVLHHRYAQLGGRR